MLADCGLTPQRYLLLLTIEAQSIEGEATVSSLADDLEMPQSTVSDLVARAHGAGLLVRRRSDGDARVSHLSLTAEGHHRLYTAVDALRAERGVLRATLVGLSQLI